MTVSEIDALVSLEAKKTSTAINVRRSAFYIDGGGEPIFAWLHQHAERSSAAHGVILCSPIGCEQLHAHRSLQSLADSLALQAIPALRFDWHGTGDSAGCDGDPQRYRTWLTNVSRAIHWMRTDLGCRRISLIGLRLGGLIAAQATLGNEIDNLVLWSPVIKGRSYVREMKALNLTAEVPSRTPKVNSNDSHDIEAAGFLLSAETANDLNVVDLSASLPRCGRVLVVSRVDYPVEERLCHHWTMQGLNVEQISVPGYLEMMEIPHRSQVPNQAIERITQWLTGEIDDDPQQRVGHVHTPQRSSISMITDMTLHSDESELPIRESIFYVDRDPKLFGILSEPLSMITANSPTIVLLNAGAAHRIGPNRINVMLARSLAAEGFRCLRIDIGGLGDSACGPLEGVVDPYPATVFSDIQRTLEQLKQDVGAKRIVLMGLCSGAYAAFQAAVQIDNPSLVGSVLINPLTFFWTEGMSIDDSPTKQLRNFHYYKSVLLDPRKWLKLFCGQSKIGIKGAILLMAHQFKLIQSQASSRTTRERIHRPENCLAHPWKEDLGGDLKRIGDSGRMLAMFFSRSDPGFGILNFHARKRSNQLQAKGILKINFIEDADHTFTMQAARKDLIEAVSHYLRTNYPVRNNE